MSRLENLSKFCEPVPSPYKSQTDTLLHKYQIPLNHFEFDYVAKCVNGQELERILEVLLSGEEGYYPELIKATQDRLAVINPISKSLRTSCPVLGKNDLNPTELNKISEDMKHWLKTVTKNNNELHSKKNNVKSCTAKIRTKMDIPQNNKTSVKECKRIPSYDYQGWDKYDPDTEILKMDMEEENKKKHILKAQQGFNVKGKAKKSVTFNKYATEAEAIFLSDRQREKGNEFFKAGDYEEALASYTESISCKPTTKNLTNRATTYFKLKMFSNTIEDCNRSLAIDVNYLKARLKKAQALEQLQKYDEALSEIYLVIEKDPNNYVAQELAERVRQRCQNVLKNTKLKIVEIE